MNFTLCCRPVGLIQQVYCLCNLSIFLKIIFSPNHFLPTPTKRGAEKTVVLIYTVSSGRCEPFLKSFFVFIALNSVCVWGFPPMLSVFQRRPRWEEWSITLPIELLIKQHPLLRELIVPDGSFRQTDGGGTEEQHQALQVINVWVCVRVSRPSFLTTAGICLTLVYLRTTLAQCAV